MSTMFPRPALLAVTALLLAGCQTAAEMRANDENRCRSYGFRAGTDAFAECLQRIDLDRRADLRASTREAMFIARTRVAVHHHHHHRR